MNAERGEENVSDGVSRLGLGLETCLETSFFGVSVSKVSGLVSVSKDFGLGLELLVSTLCMSYFFEFLQEGAL